jgi:HTH-type transcriptional regulator / antitoxin HigA
MATMLTEEYSQLQSTFALRPIRTKAHRNQAQKVLDRLTVRDEASLSSDESDYLDVLSNLIEHYDIEHTPMPTRKDEPHERLVDVMESSGATPTELSKLLGISQPQMSLILSGKRGISKAIALKLASHYKLSVAYFL